ncbi:MAG: ribonuclease P protein component [Bdellovibrionaceae bacterium]|nr:ribonuclease P protein component [Bdellovibrionales bacterium]MCB9253382.1 ribonuclease P protein component [Pseudobdellovibrionaceae bacterium]
MSTAVTERFPKTARLLRTSDFSFRPFKRFETASFRIFYTTAGSGRLGLSISKRVLKNASARNRVRRLAREAFRKNRELFAGMDLNVVGRERLREAWKQLSTRDVASELSDFIAKTR